LGSCPGGWSQVASQIIKTGKIMSIDIKDMDPIKNLKFIKGDILETQLKMKLLIFLSQI
jgi:23S rRNA (uridine2552-2'-O)-methyltransferase